MVVIGWIIFGHIDNKNEINELYTHTLLDNITGDTTYQCLYCKYSFASNNKLRQHIKLDHSSRPHLCMHCPQEFHSKNGLVWFKATFK